VGEFFLIVGLVILTAVIFVVWLTVHLTGVIFRAIFRSGGSDARKAGASAALLPAGRVACLHAGCRAGNPEHARFCRRCGGVISRQSQQAHAAARMRYVA
jgi:hypothetical protein